MIHGYFIAVVVATAWLLRWAIGPLLSSKSFQTLPWSARWLGAYLLFVWPPLLLLVMSVAVLMMGTDTAHYWEGLLSYWVSLVFLGVAIAQWLRLLYIGRHLKRQTRTFPDRQVESTLGQKTIQVMSDTAPYSAVVGWIRPRTVISTGLLEHLSTDHLDAVLAHEQGHQYYRDNLGFFWLGGLHALTNWLPYSDRLWQELLLLREIRADSWASQHVDRLLLAEALVDVVTLPFGSQPSISASFSCQAPLPRFRQRIDALLSDQGPSKPYSPLLQWLPLTLALAPLLLVPFHH